jgi:hypothetical protein
MINGSSPMVSVDAAQALRSPQDGSAAQINNKEDCATKEGEYRRLVDAPVANILRHLPTPNAPCAHSKTTTQLPF